MTTQHSPLPWFTERAKLFDNDESTIGNLEIEYCDNDTQGRSAVELEMSMGNAALIVRSVNNLPKCIEALEKLIEHLESKETCEEWEDQEHCPLCVARDALVAAKGGQA